MPRPQIEWVGSGEWGVGSGEPEMQGEEQSPSANSREPAAARQPSPDILDASFPASAPLPTPRGLVLVLGGVGGLDWCGFNMRRVARASRLPCAVESFRWGHGFGRWYADLTNVAHGGLQAARVAEAI